jgi:AbrB family looped-hinge helix DNA binding protein
MKSFHAKLTSKGQLTLPVEIRQSLGVGPGDRVEFYLHRTGEVFVHARNRPASAIFGKGAAYARPVTRDQYERLLGEAVAARGKSTQQPAHKGRKVG